MFLHYNVLFFLQIKTELLSADPVKADDSVGDYKPYGLELEFPDKTQTAPLEFTSSKLLDTNEWKQMNVDSVQNKRKKKNVERTRMYKQRDCKYPDIEAALFKWWKEFRARDSQVAIDGWFIKSKAQE